uniref:Neurotransmitter-gated ion-channel transmembrane domain-containing protein n=2 Tax=Clytia hemisphaerica TaxID=252671 RepID=A0A7M5URL0_9CNID
MTVIGMLTILSFLLPAESGERISLAITLLLAMTVFMLVVADIIPATSDVIPLVGIFFSASMIEMVIMIVVLCYIMRLYHKGPNDPPMPLWMKKYIYDWLSYKMRVRKQSRKQSLQRGSSRKDSYNYHKLNAQNDEEDIEHVKWNKRSLNNIIFNKLNNYQHNNQNNQHQEERLSPLLFYNHFSNFQPSTLDRRQTALNPMKVRRTGRHNHQPPPFGVTNLVTRPTESQIMLSKMEALLKHIRQVEYQNNIRNQWRTVAKTLDYCLFIFFFIT